MRRSFLNAANDPACDFPLANLPCGVFSTGDGPRRCGVAIGDRVLDLTGAEAAGLTGTGTTFAAPSWNAHMAQGRAAWVALRGWLTAALAEGSALEGALAPHLAPLSDVSLHMPFAVAEFTDFYAGRHHAQNIGTMLRGADNALPSNWDHMPIGYNGRASTVVVSGTPVRRPMGQLKPPGTDAPVLAPTRKLDFELELGAVVGTPSPMGEPVGLAQARAMIFGYVLLNDWSARDMQAFEYQPLGPFQAKAFATTISPWIVTAAALAPFAVAQPEPAVPLLPHLAEPQPAALDIELSVEVAGVTVTRANARHLSYSAAQQLVHHASSGCAMRTGDLLGSGTISGPQPGTYGSMMELSWNGRDPVPVGDGTRTFLEDGDTVTMRGAAQRDGVHIGFGACAGTVVSPHRARADRST